MFSILEKKFLLYSIPILLVSLIGTVYPMLERGVILKHLDLVDLGTYALAFKVSSISLIVSTGITMGVVPQLLNGKANKIADRTVILDLSLYLLVISIAATFLASHIFVFLEKNVNTTAIYFSAFFISSGFAANGLAAVLGIGVLISGKTKYRLLINIFFTFFGLILLPHVVTYFGILGVACLFFLTRLLVLLVEAVVAHRLTGLEWQSSCLHITILPLAIILCLTSIS